MATREWSRYGRAPRRAGGVDRIARGAGFGDHEAHPRGLDHRRVIAPPRAAHSDGPVVGAKSGAGDSTMRCVPCGMRLAPHDCTAVSIFRVPSVILLLLVPTSR